MIEKILIGAAGGFIKSLLETGGRVALPKLEDAPDGTKYVHFGFLINVVLGAASGFLAPEPMSAFTGGISAAFVGEKVAEKVAEKAQ